MFTLPVSIGEALDKLTILDIKIEKIKDPERNKHCKVEYDILYDKLKESVHENKFYYNKLKEINKTIWEIQEPIRENLNDNAQKCIDILNFNDSRFRIKDILNRKANSIIQEQKGYPLTKVLVIPHQGLGDHVNIIGAVRYLSTIYDEVHLGVCSSRTRIENIKSFYSDNSSIKIVDVAGEYYSKKELEIELKITNYTKSHLLGVYLHFYQPISTWATGTLPDVWYDQLNIDRSIRTSYFYVPDTLESKKMYELLQGIPYIFCHRQSSRDSMVEMISWDKESILTIDPDFSVYSEGDKWYNISQEFVNKPFWHYYETIRHASELHLVDSSFFCIASHLTLDAYVRKIYNPSEHINKEFLNTWTTP